MTSVSSELPRRTMLPVVAGLLLDSRRARHEAVAMVRRTPPWVATLLLVVGGCSPTGGGDAGPSDAGDAGDLTIAADAADGGEREPCSDEGGFTCGLRTRQCCGGAWIEYVDGPCHPHPDGGGAPPTSCDTWPTEPGCPCDTAGASVCLVYLSQVDCIGGVWTLDRTHACCS